MVYLPETSGRSSGQGVKTLPRPDGPARLAIRFRAEVQPDRARLAGLRAREPAGTDEQVAPGATTRTIAGHLRMGAQQNEARGQPGRVRDRQRGRAVGQREHHGHEVVSYEAGRAGTGRRPSRFLWL